MGNGAWVSIVGIGFLLFVLWMVANAPKVDAALIEAKGAARVEANEPAQPQSEAPGQAWRTSGWLIAVCGTIGLIVGFSMGTSVETFSDAAASAYMPSSVVNLDLLFRKGVTIAASLFAIGLGIFSVAVGSIIGAVSARGGDRQ